MNDVAPRTVYAVSELAEILRALVEDSLPRVWVEGEVSNFSRPASGHWYFTLKDEQAQIRTAMFRNANYLIRPQPKNGDRVRVRAAVSYYTARGDLQLICEYLEPAGEGALLRAFEELKRRLSAEGLFDTALKRPLPALPRSLGLITSATGAAVQDVLAALSRRFPLLRVGLWPVPVQGAAAAPAIVKALRELPRRMQVDAILLVRGGGSLEDLWAFNEESVARAVRACAVPVITGIGHEIDFSIADFAADLRAPTPTAAAELISPDRERLLAQIGQAQLTLARSLQRGVQTQNQRLDRAGARLLQLHPQRALQQRAQQLDDSAQDLQNRMRRQLREARERLGALTRRLGARQPRADILRAQLQVDQWHQRLRRSMQSLLHLRGESWRHQHAQLQSLSAQSVLDRGYAIARTAEGTVIRDPAAISTRQSVELVLARGSVQVRRAE